METPYTKMINTDTRLFQKLKEKAIEWAFIGLLGFLALNIIEPVRTWAVDMINSPTEIKNIQRSNELIMEQLNEILGKNRVIKELPDLSYVVEPVGAGETIELVIYIGRTDIGLACVALAITPLFEGSDGGSQSGVTMKPKQQIGPGVKRRRLFIEQPERLPSGNTSVWLQIHYDCGGENIYEATTPVQFMILE